MPMSPINPRLARSLTYVYMNYYNLKFEIYLLRIENVIKNAKCVL